MRGQTNNIALRNITRAINRAKFRILQELRLQGHVASGKTEAQTRVEVNGHISTGLIAHVIMPDHVAILDKGVKPSRVPYYEGSRRKSSKYIDALVVWLGFVKPSANKKEKKGIAFAIARTAKEQGHPTIGSYKFSKNGRRKNWTKHAINPNEIDELLGFDEIANSITEEFKNAYINTV